MLITEFYKNQEIFVTGGTGFIGKALIEKLLRSCPEIGKIYLLVRGKKGKTAQERLAEVLNTSLFNRLRDEQPAEIFEKVHAIEGDCSELGLDISAQDLQKLANVSIVFHSAASVRFDDPLRDSILLNTRGTYELVKIAETMQNLKVFVHVSTTYCNPDKQVVQEAIYPPYADWRTTIKLAETYSTEILNIFNLKYGNNQPNTYTFTKSLAEQIINEHKHKLPLIIFRPSIVISTIEEPVPGWVDNFNGPLGMLVACGVGILRTNYGNPDVVSDFVPADIVVRGMIIAAYKRGITNVAQTAAPLEIINCATANIRPITMGEVIEIGKLCIKENPFEKTLWVPGGSITQCPFWNFIRFVTLHIFMAIIVDALLRIGNKKPFLLKLQRRIYAANLALHFFVTRTWDFKNNNFTSLENIIPKSEIEKFGFMRYSNVNYIHIFRNGIRGAKEFLLKEAPDATKGARIRFRIFQVIHYTILTLCFVFVTLRTSRFLSNWFKAIQF